MLSFENGNCNGSLTIKLSNSADTKARANGESKALTVKVSFPNVTNAIITSVIYSQLAIKLGQKFRPVGEFPEEITVQELYSPRAAIAFERDLTDEEVAQRTLDEIAKLHPELKATIEA